MLAAALAALSPRPAGHLCEETPQDVQQGTRGMALAEHVQHRLHASGPQVVLLARAAQNHDKYHLRYSHLGSRAGLDGKPVIVR
jgi:hypothetical protein